MIETQKIGMERAIMSLRPNSDFTTAGNEITWLDPSTSVPSQAEIDAEVIRLQAEYDAAQYQRDRQSQYPDIGDQLDALYHAGTFPSDMAAKLKAVKDANPKG
jgi:hypothetical protein